MREIICSTQTYIKFLSHSSTVGGGMHLVLVILVHNPQ